MEASGDVHTVQLTSATQRGLVRASLSRRRRGAQRCHAGSASSGRGPTWSHQSSIERPAKVRSERIERTVSAVAMSPHNLLWQQPRSARCRCQRSPAARQPSGRVPSVATGRHDADRVAAIGSGVITACPNPSPRGRIRCDQGRPSEEPMLDSSRGEACPEEGKRGESGRGVRRSASTGRVDNLTRRHGEAQCSAQAAVVDWYPGETRAPVAARSTGRMSAIIARLSR